MLELFGAFLLFLVAIMAVMVWMGIRLARRMMARVQGVMGAFAQGATGPTAYADPRWSRMAGHLDRRQREAARLAHARIDGLLAERGGAALTPEEAQLMIACEKRVPELLDACLDRCAGARPDERCDYATATLDRLVRLGEEAAAARSAIRQRGDHRLTTMHNYFDTVATRDRA